MRYREFKKLIDEARGLLFRKSGETFFLVKDPKKFIEVQQVFNFPENTQKFKDIQERDATLNKFMQTHNIKEIHWFNQPANNLAFSIGHFKNENTQDVYYGRYFTSNTGTQWKTSGNDFKSIGYQLNIPGALKSSYKMQPKDLEITGAIEFKNPNEIINKINDPIIKEGLSQMPKQLPLFNVDPAQARAVATDLGETVGPIALWHGMIGEAAEEAKKDLLKGKNWNTCKISFPDSKIEGLVDSIMRPPVGQAIGISSKAGQKGADPSIKNLMAGVLKLEKDKNKNPNASKIFQTYKKAIDIIKTLATNNSLEGPVQVALQRNLINPATADALRNTQAGSETAQQKKQLQWLTKFKKSKVPNKAIFKYWALAGLAQMLANNLNEDTDLKLNEAGIQLLNTSPLVQLYMQTTTQDNGVKVSGFKSVYPPQFKGSVIINSRLYETSRAPVGRMTFGFRGI